MNGTNRLSLIKVLRRTLSRPLYHYRHRLKNTKIYEDHENKYGYSFACKSRLGNETQTFEGKAWKYTNNWRLTSGKRWCRTTNFTGEIREKLERIWATQWNNKEWMACRCHATNMEQKMWWAIVEGNEYLHKDDTIMARAVGFWKKNVEWLQTW